MSNQQSPFVHTLLESKLWARQSDALKYVSVLSKEEVLRIDSGGFTEIVRQFAVVPPILRRDLMVADERIIESIDIISERKTGDTNYSFLIPIERDPDWLEEVSSQRTYTDDYPLAFLDHNHAVISIRLSLSPEDPEGELKRRLDYRADRVEQYARSVAERISQFNKKLAKEMTDDLNKRKAAIVKAENALAAIGLPRVYNPEHEERAIQIERLLRGLGTYLTDSSSRGASKVLGVRSFIVHGHDHLLLYELKDYIQNTLKLGEPVVLRQMPGLGRTIIEKFEDEAETINLVFVLLTPDDRVTPTKNDDQEKRRARQNVILELGFFLGKLGRKSGRILLLHKGHLEIPSDIAGVEYIPVTDGIESAGERIRKELRALGILKH